jgi:hypothetical protein
MGSMKVHLILSKNDSFSNEMLQRNAGSDLYVAGASTIQYEKKIHTFLIRKFFF